MYGLQAQPQKFWFADNLGKSPENPGKNGAQRCLTLKSGAKVCIKTHEDLYLEVAPKSDLHDHVGENFWAKLAQKTFRASLGKFGQNPSRPNNLPTPTPVMKRHLCSRCHSVEKAEGKMPSPYLRSPASLCILIHVHSLLVAVGCNV